MSDVLRRYYSARAGEYEQVYAKPERQQDLRAIAAWLPPLLAGRSVLEIACGTGYWTRIIAPATRQIVALDAVAEPLEIARRMLPDGHVTFRRGDAYELGAEPGRFDAAFAGFWLSHVPRRRLPGFLRQLAGRLEPGSRVVFLDNRYVEGSSTRICEQDADGDTYQLRRLADGSTHRVLKNFPTPSELRALAEPVSQACQYHEWPHYWGLSLWTPASAESVPLPHGTRP